MRSRAFTPYRRLYGFEPASFIRKGQRLTGTFVSVPMIYFSTEAPVCTGCGHAVTWLRKPDRVGRSWRYSVCCPCGVDEIVTRLRLVQGGDEAYWKQQGWDLHRR